MEAHLCAFCSKNNTAIRCDTCKAVSCKHCSFFIDEHSFEFINLLPKNLIHKTFCPDCYTGGIAEEIEQLHETLRLAKDVNIYEKKQGTETRLLRRIEKPVHIKDCDDREEALLCLAFFAAQKGFNTLVDLELKATKVKLGGTYKKMVWSGSAVPINT